MTTDVVGSGQNWPKYEEKYVQDDIVQVVIQINGKKRAIVEVGKDSGQDLVIETLKNTENIFNIYVFMEK